MKDLFRIVSRRFMKEKKKAVSTLAIIITFVMVYTLIMPAVALERKAAENEPGIALEETVSGDAMAEAEPESLEAEAAPAEESESESDAEAVVEEEPAAEEIAAESVVPAAEPAADNSVVNDDSAAVQTTDAVSSQGSSRDTEVTNEFDGNQSAAEGSADPSVSDADETDAEEGMPAQKYEQTIKFNEIIDEEGNTVEKQVKVKVDAEKDAFPAGAVMKAEVVLTNIDPQRLQDMEDAIKAAVKKEAEKSGLNADDTRIVQYQAIDISFLNKEGQKIEPAKKVEVRITSDKIREIENPVLVHVNENANTGVIKDADVIEKKDIAIIDEQPDTIDNNENTMLFRTSRFSPFVIVESEIVDENGGIVNGLEGEYRSEASFVLADENGNNIAADGSGVLMADGGDYNVTVSYDANANIPENAELDIKEIKEASRTYQNYMEEAKDVLEGNDASAAINYAKFFDISIVSGGETVTPETKVDVDIAYKNSEKIEEGTVVRALEFGEGSPAVSEDAFVYGDETHIDGMNLTTEEFPVYGIFGTEITTEWTLTTPEGMSLTYDVTVKYGADANIPNGSTLSVTEFDEEDEEFQKAKDALLDEDSLPDEDLEETIIDNSGEVPTYSYISRPVIYEDDFGMKALDISIIGPDGEKIEPDAAVEVSITLKQLPEDVEKEVLEDSMSVAHLKEEGENIQVETVASADENYPGDIQLLEDTAEITFSVESFSTFTISWNQDNRTRRSTVHYVDTSGNELTVSNSNFRGNDLDQTPAYLIYDIEGYEYVKTTLGSVNGTAIRPMLRHTYSNRAWHWQYTTGTGTDDVTWNNLDYGTTSNRNVYVVYKPKATPSNGGTPKAEETGEKPLDPSIHKGSKSNHDGTNTLSLSITGHTAPTKVEKLADVIVIFDISGSMNNNMTGGNITGQDENDTAAGSNHNSRLWIAYDAVSKLADNLLSSERVNSNNEKLIRMSLISFSNTAEVVSGFTDNPTTFKNAVGDLHAIGGTNWEAALRLANTSFTMASDPEHVGNMELDPNRATFVVFVTDGAPTFRLTRYDVNDNGFNNDISNNWYRNFGVFGQGNSDTHSYNYNAALTEATSIVGHSKNFYSIGISSTQSELTKLDNLAAESGAGSDHSVIATTEEDLIEAFDDIAEKITGLLGFGDINMTDGITDLSNTVMEKASLIGVSDDFEYWKAPAPANWSTMTNEQKAAYRPSDADFVSWDPSSEKCLLASYNDTSGAVEWHMGPNFVPEDGCSYKVTFSVWPSQEAYDWIADLKNGTRTWADVVAAGLDYPDGANPQIKKNGDDYELATNKPGANTTYKAATKTGDTVTTTGDPIVLAFNSVDPMELTEEEMVVRKRFSHDINSVSPLTKIRFTLYRGEETYKKADGTDYTIELPKVEGATPEQYEHWEDNVYIAAGLLKTIDEEPGYQVLESGHDYTLKEDILSGDEYEYQFTPQIVRPMVIGTTLTYLVQKDEYHTNPDGADEYEIEGNTYYVLGENDQALTGTNRKTAELDITKKVVDATGRLTEAQLAAETFTYKITLTVPEGADTSGIMGYEYVPRLNDKVPGEANRPRFYLFGYQDETFNYVDINGQTQTQEADPANSRGFSDDIAKFKQKVYGGWNAQIHNMFGDGNTVTFYMTLDNDEVIRLTNLPQGTQYTITEYYANVHAADTGAPSPASDRAPNVEEQGYSVSVATLNGSPAVSTVVTANDTVSGTITDLDTRYYNQFTNTLDKHLDVELKARKHLNGYVWNNEQYFINLSTDEGNQLPGRVRFYRQFAAGSAGDADQNGYTFGKIRFTEPGTYKYYIAEDNAGETIDGIRYDESKTVTIVIAEDTTTHDLYVESVTGDDTTWNADTLTSMTTITNSRITANVKVLKIGDSQTTNVLSDVSFELYSTYVGPDSSQNVKAKKADGTEYGTLTTGPDGTFIIDGLIPSTEGTVYYLVETVAKSGYKLLISPVEIKVYLTDDAPYYEVSYEQTDYSASTGAGRIQPDEEGNCLIVVDNKSGVELPHTGGAGTLPYTLSGFALMMASALMYGFRMRRRERRLN